MSATYDSAIKLADKFPKIKFTVIDSKHVSTAVGFMALLAAVLSRRGLSMEEIVKQVTILRDSITTYFSIENLENLKRLGRLSLTQYKLAKTFKIIPVARNQFSLFVPICPIISVNIGCAAAHIITICAHNN